MSPPSFLNALFPSNPRPLLILPFSLSLIASISVLIISVNHLVLLLDHSRWKSAHFCHVFSTDCGRKSAQFFRKDLSMLKYVKWSLEYHNLSVAESIIKLVGMLFKQRQWWKKNTSETSLRWFAGWLAGFRAVLGTCQKTKEQLCHTIGEHLKPV